MNLNFRFLIFAFHLVATSASALDYGRGSVGFRNLEVLASHRNSSMSVTVWYPASHGGTMMLVGDSPVFKGVPARSGAAIAKGVFPLVLMAHGGLRSAPHLSSWAGAYLAAHGFVVAIPRPPQPGMQNVKAAIPEIWLRPADYSATLDALANNQDFSGHIKTGRVGVVGFQLGGTTALAVAGAMMDVESFRHSCDVPATGPDCDWFASQQVNLTQLDLTELSAAHLDKRVVVVVAIDPELSLNFTSSSLREIQVPVKVINLGSPVTLLPGLNASGLQAFIPQIQYEIVQDASQYSSFSECVAEAPEVLRLEGEDTAICNDGGGRPRSEIHAQLAAMIEAELKQQLY